jgi:hypothetical protein
LSVIGTFWPFDKASRCNSCKVLEDEQTNPICCKKKNDKIKKTEVNKNDKALTNRSYGKHTGGVLRSLDCQMHDHRHGAIGIEMSLSGKVVVLMLECE